MEVVLVRRSQGGQRLSISGSTRSSDASDVSHQGERALSRDFSWWRSGSIGGLLLWCFWVPSFVKFSAFYMTQIIYDFVSNHSSAIAFIAWDMCVFSVEVLRFVVAYPFLKMENFLFSTIPDAVRNLSLLATFLFNHPSFDSIRALAPLFVMYFAPSLFILVYMRFCRREEAAAASSAGIFLDGTCNAVVPPRRPSYFSSPVQPSLRLIALSAQNVHEPLVEGPAFRTFSALARAATSSLTFTVFLSLAKLRRAISRKPAGLPKSVSTAALGVLSESWTLDRTIRVEGVERTFGFVVAVVYRTIESHVRRKDLERRLAEELSEGVGFCARGKVGRVINSLRGYGVIEGEMEIETFHSAFVKRVISPAISFRTKRGREKAANDTLDDFGIFDAKMRSEWVEQACETV